MKQKPWCYQTKIFHLPLWSILVVWVGLWLYLANSPALAQSPIFSIRDSVITGRINDKEQDCNIHTGCKPFVPNKEPISGYSVTFPFSGYYYFVTYGVIDTFGGVFLASWCASLYRWK